MEKQETKISAVAHTLTRVASSVSQFNRSFDKLLREIIRMVMPVFAILAGFAILLSKTFKDPDQAKQALPVIAAIGGVIVTIFIAYVFFRSIVGLQQESRTYAHNISRRETSLPTDNEESPAAATEETEPLPIDASNPSALFKVSRQRLLDEAVRIDAISRRNLGIGILFSSIALAVLAWPLISAVFVHSPEPTLAELKVPSRMWLELG